jgi:hypothetical protein
MRIDFWNNPILVTSVRRRFKGGGLLQVTLFYPLILMVIGAALPYFFPQLEHEWPYYGFNALIVWQYVSSGFLAMAAGSHSLKSEVTNQTLDFLRLTPLTPRQILIGKLLGAITLPTFLSIASFPVAVLCWGLGGVSFHLALLLYFNLFVYILASGATAMVMRLELREDKRVEAHGMAVSGVLTGFLALATLFLPEPARSAILLFLPLPLLVLAYVNFHVMVRSLASPLNPPVSKGLAYVLAVGLSLVLAFLAGLNHRSAGQAAVAYWIFDTILIACLIMTVTPWREVLRSWTWRFRGLMPRHRDEWLGDRSVNTTAVLTLVLIGLASYLIVFLPLAWLMHGSEAIKEEIPALSGAALLSVAMLLMLGFVLQWALLIAGRNGRGWVLIFFFSLLIPQVVALLQNMSWLAQLSPYVYYSVWHQDPERVQPLLPVLLLGMAVVACAAWRSQRFLLSRMEQAIDRKLEKMGVLKPMPKHQTA